MSAKTIHSKQSFSLMLLSGIVASSVALSGCGGSSGSGSSKPGGSGSGSSSSGSVSVISTPQGNALSIPFTFTAEAPYDYASGPSRTLLAGNFPFGQPSIGGSCGATFNTSTSLSWCNVRDRVLNLPTTFFNAPVFGSNVNFGSISLSAAPGFQTNPYSGSSSIYGGYGGGYGYSTSGPSGAIQKRILGYTDIDGMSSITLAVMNQTTNTCSSNFQSRGFYQCVNTTVSGVAILSPQFIRENMPSGPTVSRVAFYMDASTLSGTIFIVSPAAGNSTIADF